MPKNQVGIGTRVQFVASADRDSGDFVYEDGFHGVVVNDVLDTEIGVLDISVQEIEIDLVGASTRGSRVYITPAGSLTNTASTNRPVGIVTAVVADGVGVASGKMRMLVLPQNPTTPA
jgi:predicted RecA/RadA family phage recombinase